MLQHANLWLLWFSAVGCGLMAGVYFTFSTFVMRALNEVGAAAGTAAMQSINVVILRSPFMPLFFATTISGAALVVIALMRWGEAGSGFALAGGVIYVVGMFVLTAAFNVPLNDRLATVSAGSSETVEMWTVYLRDWTRWNHVRTLASGLSCILFIQAIVRSYAPAG